MGEFVDILDSSGQPTQRTCLKSEAHKFGYWHPCVHIWFYTNNNEVLVQKRALIKDTFPNLWDVSVAGHVICGENLIAAAQREVFEEIGLRINKNELKEIATFKYAFKHSEYLIDKEFCTLYISKLNVEIEKLVLQVEEVADIKLIPILRLKKELFIKNKLRFVPYSNTYFSMVFNAIKRGVDNI